MDSMRENVKNLGDKLAYVYHETESLQKVVTYNDILHSRSLEVALSQLPKDVCVGLHITNNPCVPIIIYHLLKLDVPFTFLDLEKPLQNIKDLKLFAIISCGPCQGLEALSANTKLLNLVCGSELHLYYLHEDCWKPDYARICYVIQTSGTLGQKKTVRVTLDCIATNISSLKKLFNLNREDKIYFGTPFSFDPSIIELFLSLSTGCCLIAASPQIKSNPERLFNTLFLTETITFLQMCPSVFLQFQNVEFILRRSSLRILCLGGESFPEDLLRFAGGNVRIFNLYGITEVSCWASAQEITDGEGVCLGQVLDETIFEVRDDEEKKVEDGDGQLFIGSNTRICLLDDEEFSNIKLPIFRNSGDIVNKSNNIYRYKGRSNDVVKKFGTKINLHELQQQISSSVNLPSKCVWDETSKKITTFITIPNLVASKKPKILDKIRVKLIKDFKWEYFPDHIELITDFPLTQNGKIDTEFLLQHCISKTRDSLSISESFSLLFCKFFGLNEEEVAAKKHLTFSEFGGSSMLKLQFIEEMLDSCQSQMDKRNLFLLLDMSYEAAKSQLEINKESNENETSVFEQTESKFFKLNWKKDLFACIDTKPTIIPNSDSKYIPIGNFANLFTVLNASNGAEISSTFLDNSIENACLVSPCRARVFVGCFDSHLYCLDIKTCTTVWKFQTQDKIKNTPVLSTNKSQIIFGSYDKFLYCLNIKSGSLVWKRDLSEAITANPINVFGKIYVGCIKGRIVCVDESKGEVLWSYQAKNPIFSEAQSDQVLVIFCDVFGYFYAFDLKLGKLMWIFEATNNSNIFCPFLVYNSQIIFGKQDGYIYILHFNETECALKLSQNLHHEISTQPMIIKLEERKTHLILTSSQGLIFLCKLGQNLEILDRFSLGNQSFSPPTICDNKLFIGCRDNHLYCIDINC